VINHPLSRLILGQFQDKDGCSKNGCCELLFDLGVVSCKEDYRAYLRNSINNFVDVNRGVPYMIFKKIILVGEEGDLGERILNFSTCEFSNLVIISDPTSSNHSYPSSFYNFHSPTDKIYLICKRELKVLTSCLKETCQTFELPYNPDEQEKDEEAPFPTIESSPKLILDKVVTSFGVNGFSLCDGHVIGF